ncbi:class I SAM-dependent methyltransferase [Parafilimonas sp.]|uniref:class I SAM-dependent methyltransferase n=1 Tax=Parafilimonas sp. TaxID=1969739 RepID=UPI0039E55E88
MECSNCKCIQLMQIPESFSKYYPDNYYSYNGNPENKTIQKSFFKTFKRNLKAKLLDNYLEGENLIGRLMKTKFNGYYPWIKAKTFKSTSKILDIGCGSGELLLRMYNDGFRNLTGADPFIARPITYECGINIYKKQLEELSGNYDIIMLHHAFEHLAEPLKVLQSIHNLLAAEGLLIIRIPVADCFAWRRYGTNWVQLDAPRHIFLHTPKSIEILSRQSGFEIEDIIYDSYYLQFAGSEKYLRDIALTDKTELFTSDEINDFNKKSIELNALRDGDQACFYLRKMN